MGWGDELIAAGQARAMFEKDPRKVRIVDRNGQLRQHEAWVGNPSIATPWETGDFQRLANGPGARPYIQDKYPDRWVWKPFQCTPAQLRLNAFEIAVARRAATGCVVVEPTVKRKASPNKDWGWKRWEAFAALAIESGLRLVQLGADPERVLRGATWIATPSMRLACAVLATATAYVGHEGGLHHAAAALNIPGVVIFGGFIAPQNTGYAMHRNLFTGGEACGYRHPCEHCAQAMAAIEPEQVLAELLAVTPLEVARPR